MFRIDGDFAIIIITITNNIGNLSPACSRALTAAMVEPFGLVTSSLSWPGCKPATQFKVGETYQCQIGY